MSLTDEVKAHALSVEADLVGVASVDRFEGAPENFNPQTLLPQTKSVISMAIRHLHGVLVPQRELVENYQYQIFGYGWLSHIRLNWVAFEVSRFLEDRGYITLPFPSFCETQNPPGARRRGASISNRHAAVAAGVAEFGWHNLAMTPKFGTKQRYVTVMTSAELEPDPMLEVGLCDYPNCRICVEKCPAGAIHPEEPVTFDLAGKTINMSKLDKPACVRYHHGESPETFLFQPARQFTTFTMGGHCGMCLINCPKGEYKPK